MRSDIHMTQDMYSFHGSLLTKGRAIKAMAFTDLGLCEPGDVETGRNVKRAFCWQKRVFRLLLTEAKFHLWDVVWRFCLYFSFHGAFFF